MEGLNFCLLIKWQWGSSLAATQWSERSGNMRGEYWHWLESTTDAKKKPKTEKPRAKTWEKLLTRVLFARIAFGRQSCLLQCCSKLTSLCFPLHLFKNMEFAPPWQLESIHRSCCRTLGWGGDFLPHSDARTHLLKGLAETLQTAATIWGLQRSFLTALDCLVQRQQDRPFLITLIRYFEVFLTTKKARDFSKGHTVSAENLYEHNWHNSAKQVTCHQHQCHWHFTVYQDKKQLKICLAQALQWMKLLSCVTVGKIS